MIGFNIALTLQKSYKTMRTGIIIIGILLLCGTLSYSQTNKKIDPTKFNMQLENGKVKMNRNYVNFGTISNTDVKTDTIIVYNTTESEDITMKFNGVPKHVTIKMEPSTIKPKETANIIVTYDAAKNVTGENKQVWGRTNNRIQIEVNGNTSNSPRNLMTIAANIQEDFSKYTPKQLKNAPKIVFESKEYNYGKVKQGEVVKHDFVFTNTGKNDLEIRSVKAG
ncbi:MAG: hypothetical protein Kow0068_09330 [Marinilabiliales bacterium]